MFNESALYTSSAAYNLHLQSIQATNIFYQLMMNEIKKQDKLTDSMIAESDPESILPTTYHDRMSSPEKDQWSRAIGEELKIRDEEKVLDIQYQMGICVETLML
ncbi:hypothetical protein O181_019802 [Austropuccinia psidii MF-1]|uniref:Uncharacterized protein n=1 Tax=Austropuccinia psidii MF-1 TaxID=1389203 RepID=A0A9Q3GUS6_9BASI|nr:hypothetical protein [Austropuccinia psidii MF-1]